MELKATHFGNIEYGRPDVVRMAKGFLGYEHLKRFIVVSLEEQKPFKSAILIFPFGH